VNGSEPDELDDAGSVTPLAAEVGVVTLDASVLTDPVVGG
jgi:hypothetical protein